MADQTVEGAGNNTAGRDNNFTQVFVVAPTKEIKDHFSKINEEIKELFGSVSITTLDRADFDCEKLFASLVNIGIPSNISLTITFNIVPYIREAVGRDEEEFSTAHIRRAVSHSILHMLELELSRSQRQELAAKYARNYGNPKHINMIVFSDGRTQPITYRYLSESFLPTLLKRILGRNYKITEFISRNNVEYMSNEILECVRRLGVYHVRYETILALAEDLATQLPHPWLIYEGNKSAAIDHDVDRIMNHLAIIRSDTSTETEFWRSSYECFNHICSSILANYSCPIGGGTHAPSNTLRNVTRLAALGEHQNLALWDFCSISRIEDDLKEQGVAMNDFHQRIKLLQTAIDRSRLDRMDFVRDELGWFSNVASSLSA